MEHYLERLERPAKRKVGSEYMLVCGVCRVSWPCLGKLVEIRNRAITQGEIPQGDSRKYQDGGSSGKTT